MATPQAAQTERVLSIDALRGFDMFWIVGGRTVLKTWWLWLGLPFYPELDRQFQHVKWEGFVFYDLIFPLFLFVVGAVLPFSLAKVRPEDRTAAYGRIARRGLLLFALGLLYLQAWELNFQAFRVSGVLQRIAVCYGICALLVLHGSVRVQVGVLLALLLGYWALLALVAPPGGIPGDYGMETSLPGWVDRAVLPGKLMYYGHGDNEGILSTFGAIATTLLGVLAGHWLRSTCSGGAKFAGLVLAGLVCLLAGKMWDQVFPIIKNIWTSSYVLYAGGWSLLLLAGFYGIMDVLGYRRWAFFFVVIGGNAITIYVACKVLGLNRLFRIIENGYGTEWGAFVPALLAMALVAVDWVVLWQLYRRRLFLRV
jgi:predicted acyltransferase